MLKNILPLTLLFLFTHTNTNAAVLGDKGNGGYSVVCRNSEGLITHAEILDLYEGRLIHQLRYPTESFPIDGLIAVALRRVQGNQAFTDKLQKEIENINANTYFVPAGNDLELTEDAFPVLKRRGCNYEQLANYTNHGKLVISQEIYDHLDDLNRATLTIHEAIYAIRRKALGEDSSINARLLTAHLMSSQPDHEMIDRLVNESLQRPDATKRPCGLSGSIQERIEDCSYQEKQNMGLVLVTRTKDMKEIYKDLVTGLIWSDRLPSKVSYPTAQNVCARNDRPELGFLNLKWRLPSIDDFENSADRLTMILPNMYTDGESYWFWTSTNKSKFVKVFYGLNEVGYEYSSGKNYGSVRCISQ